MCQRRWWWDESYLHHPSKCPGNLGGDGARPLVGCANSSDSVMSSLLREMVGLGGGYANAARGNWREDLENWCNVLMEGISVSLCGRVLHQTWEILQYFFFLVFFYINQVRFNKIKRKKNKFS